MAVSNKKNCINNSELFMSAIKKGDINTVKTLIDKGMNVNRADIKENRPLFKGTMPLFRGNMPLFIASERGHLDIVRLLIKKGAKLDKADYDGWTPLIGASLMGHLEVVRLLVDAGADLNKVNDDGKTALDIAKAMGHLEIVRLLVEASADKGEEKSMDGGDDNEKKEKSMDGGDDNEKKEKKEKKKRAPSTYNLFIKQKMLEIRKNNDDIMPKECMKLATAEWKKLSDDEKDKFKKSLE